MLRRIVLLIILLAAGATWLLLSGKEPPVSTEDISRHAQDVLEATGAYTNQERAAFERATEHELERMENQIHSLRAKSGTASREARDVLDQAVAELERKQRAAGLELAKLGSSMARAWAKLRSSMSATMEDLKRSYRQAVSKTGG